MSYSRTSIVTALLFLAFACQAPAEVSINELIDEAGLREGAVATRDVESWRPPQKIVVRGAGDHVTALQAEFPDVQMVRVSSPAEVRQHAADADAIVGICDAKAVAAAQR